MTLIPAYGRDYKTEAEVIKDWNDNKDFVISDISSPWDGKYANRSDLGGTCEVKIRFNNLTEFVIFEA